MFWHRFLWKIAALMSGCTTLKVLAGAADGLIVAKGCKRKVSLLIRQHLKLCSHSKTEPTQDHDI